MAALAQLKKEERVGLGIAIAAHLALFATFILLDNRPLPTFNRPDRMTVSLADEVGLADTAPDPASDPRAAVAPTLSDDPEPVPQPEPEAREDVLPTPQPRPEPEPVRRPAPAPSPKPKPKPEPKPAPKKQEAPSKAKSSGSRIGNDFLDGASASDSGSDSGTPAAEIGPRVQASLASAITRQLKPHWSAPQGADAELLVTVLRFRLNRDGSLAGTPEVVRQSGVTPSNQAQKARHAEQAIRAVRLAAPFDLPERFYDGWKVVTSQFDRRLSQ
ncbi:energy transducer TonB [Altericroceibacterium spongiae]|uniref:Energy transducer TonB n=1 Tax=Altericroceibacterium spongiae TaxID=2320269 RepID=A0A420ELX1_9SPHN|nr:energy transducer TonB [Altericroceibacterium spongiae]RKF21681.1 energy transducer TonB [Altericroceibacterium spongiae]